MASILRAPIISEQKRKLSTRRSPEERAHPLEAISETAPQISEQSVPVLPAEPSPNVNELIEQARLAVLSQFKEEAEAARELGRQRGLQEGRQAGVEEIKKTAAAELARIQSIAGNLQQALESGIQGLEDMAVAIAFEAVCKMLGKIAVSTEGVQALVRETAREAMTEERIVVRLNPVDLSNLRKAGVLDATLPSHVAVSWEADKSIELGGCVIETSGGELDARLELQIERFRSALLTARGQRTARGGEERNALATKPERRKLDRRKANRAGVYPERRKKNRRGS